MIPNRKETSFLPLLRPAFEFGRLRNLLSGKSNDRLQIEWAIEDQAKILNSTACPNDERAFSPLNTTVETGWPPGCGDIRLLFNFDCALAQGSYLPLVGPMALNVKI